MILVNACNNMFMTGLMETWRKKINNADKYVGIYVCGCVFWILKLELSSRLENIRNF